MPNTGKEDIFYIGIKAVIQNSRGEVLLLKTNPEDFHDKTPSFWELPGGRMNQGEDVEKTVTREVLEETGIRGVEVVRFLDAIVTNARVPYGDIKAGLALFVYLCKVKNSDKVILSFEHLEYGWFPPKEAAAFLKKSFANSVAEKIKEL